MKFNKPLNKCTVTTFCDVALLNSMVFSFFSILTKKLEVENKLQESEQRKLELDDEKQRKTTGVLALQEAATKRRNDIAQQKIDKLARKEAEGQHRVEQLERDQHRRIALANEKKNRVQTRAQELQSKKMEIEEEKVCASNLIGCEDSWLILNTCCK